MMISIFEWRDTIPIQDLGRYLKDRAGKTALKDRIRRLLNQAVRPNQQPTPLNLQYFVDLFGEQVTADAIADLSKYFQLQQARGLTPGGLPTGLSPLAIQTKDVRPSNTAIAGIGEGLAGWFFTHAAMVPVARPIGGPTDLIFTDPQTSNYALVQVKSTQQSIVKGQIYSAAVDHIEHVRHVQEMDPNSTFTCNIVGIVIKGGNDFDLLSLSVNIV